MIEETILTDSATAYLVPEPFEVVLKSVRRALAEDGLDVIGELDLSGSIVRLLGVETPGCTVLCVWTPSHLEEGLLAEAPLPALLPLRVVIATRGRHTEIHILGALPGDAMPTRTHATVTAIQGCLSRTLDRIAMRQPAFSLP